MPVFSCIMRINEQLFFSKPAPLPKIEQIKVVAGKENKSIDGWTLSASA